MKRTRESVEILNPEVFEKKVKIDDKRSIKIKLVNDHFENAKRYQIPKAQLIIADIPYNEKL